VAVGEFMVLKEIQQVKHSINKGVDRRGRDSIANRKMKRRPPKGLMVVCWNQT